MAKRTYAILGASGHTGRVIGGELLKRGHEVRAIARDPAHLDGLARQGAKPHAADAADRKALVAAFRGADAAYVLIPPNFAAADFRAWQDGIGASIADAVREAGVRHVVGLSSLGGELPSGTGPIVGLHRQEERLNAVPGLNVLHLRPTYFMENLLLWMGTIKAMGAAGTSIRGDMPVEMIATEDIGRFAADALDRLDFRGAGNVAELVGPEPVRFDQAARTLGAAIGKPELRYVQFPYEDETRGMVAAGLKPDLAALYTELGRAFNEGRVRAHGTPWRGPTSLSAFASSVFAPAWKTAA